MAVRTYAQLISDISTYLVAKVRITQHSALVTNIVDTIFNQGNGSGARPYKVYTALLTQTSTNAPVATVLENTIGAIVWTYQAQGQYVATLAGAFTMNKTMINIGGISNSGISLFQVINGDLNLDQFVMQSIDSETDATTDGLLSNTPIEIRVYPT